MQYSISVPVGAWNNLLPATLKSLECQSADVQIALLDASNDPRVKAVADEFDHLLAYRRHGPDLGQSDAILEGWNNTDGEILGWLNADDSLFPRAMRSASECFADDPNLDVVYGHSTIIDGDDRMRGYHFNVEPPGERLREGCIISQPSCFFKRQTYDAVGGLNRDLHYAMDWDLWLRLHVHGANFGFIDEPMSRVLWDEQTKSASFNPRRRRELRSLIETYAPVEKQNAIFRAFAIHSYSDMIWPAALRKKTLRYLRRSGPKLFGVRADGCFMAEAELNLVHYQETAATKVFLQIDGEPVAFKISDDQGALEVETTESGVSVVLRTPAAAGKTVRLNLSMNNKPAEQPVYLVSAGWA